MIQTVEVRKDEPTGTIVVFGDSVANGLGARGPTYCRLVADALNLRLVDLSASARQITEWPNILPADERPTIAVIAHGITEAIVRPTPGALRWLPRRWRSPGWIERMSRVPWNFGGGPMIIRLRSRCHHDGRHRHSVRRRAVRGLCVVLVGAGGR